MEKVWFITGSSRGLGKELVKAVLESGDLVVATSRKKEDLKVFVETYPNQVLTLQLDVMVKPQIEDAVSKAIEKFGRIDVLVNNAGFGIIGASEAFTDEQMRSQLETNLYAPIEITRLVLPYMRKQGSGRILNISSVGGRVGNPGLTIYQAAKFGLSGYSESLSREVTPLGIFVTSVEPGAMATDWGTSSMTFAEDIEGYENTVGLMKTILKQVAPGNASYGGDPIKVSQLLIKLAESANPPVHMVVGKDAYRIVEEEEHKRLEEMKKWKADGDATDYESDESLFNNEKDFTLYK